MKPREVEEIYEDACRSAANRPVPDPSQAAAWKREFSFFDAHDLRDGLTLWWRANKWVPLPSELKPLAEQARRSRTSQGAGKTTYARWVCKEVKAHTTGGFIEPSDYKPRRCFGLKPGGQAGEICGAEMVQIFRQDGFKTGAAVRKEQVEA